MTSLSNFYIALRENCMTFECDNNRITKFKYEACLTIYKNIYKVYSVFFLLKKKKRLTFYYFNNINHGGQV